MKTSRSITILVTSFLTLSLFAQAWGKKTTNANDKYKEIIKEAQELTLNQERVKAAQLIVREIEKESKTSTAALELKKALLSLGELFYTEKAQKVFELGRSLSRSVPESGIDKYKEALSLEPGNLRILKELGRNYLYRGDCQKAYEISREALLQNPYSVEFFLLRIQSKVCMGTIEDFEAELANPFVEKESVMFFLDTLRAQILFSQEKYTEALTTLARVESTKFPEAYYLRGQVKQKLGHNSRVDYEKYVELCKEQRSKIIEQFSMEPRTCKDAKSVEQRLEQIKSERAG